MRPAIFADLTFAAARDRAVAEGKLLVVAISDRSDGCRRMDRGAWSDPQVVAWLAAHAVAIQVDTFEQHAVADELGVEGAPMVIAFVDGEEFDRILGARRPDAVLAWLAGVARGEAEPEVDIHARHDDARALLREGRFAEAVPAFVWLWDHMLDHDDSFGAVRLSYVVGELGKLVAAHPPARAVIEALRDRDALPSSGPFDDGDLIVDWCALNEALGEQARSLAWFDAIPTRSRSQLGLLAVYEYIELLEAADRWADAGTLYNPRRELDTLARLFDMERRRPRGPAPPEIEAIHTNMHRNKIARLLRALRAAGRTDEATVAETRVRELGIHLAATNN